MIEAIKYIEPMKKGETKPHLMECSDGKHYVVKFMSNPVGKKILVHEYIANELAKYLYLPIAEGQVIYISEEFIAKTSEIAEFNVEVGPHFGCLYFKNKARPTRKERIQKCTNLDQMAGVIVFDHWVRNRDRANNYWNLIIDEGESFNKLYMIDHAGCFFSSRRDVKTLRGSAHYMDVFWGEMYNQFAPFLLDENIFNHYTSAIERFPNEEIKKIVYSTPTEWEANKNELDALVDYLILRKEKVKVPIKNLLMKHLHVK